MPVAAASSGAVIGVVVVVTVSRAVTGSLQSTRACAVHTARTAHGLRSEHGTHDAEDTDHPHPPVPSHQYGEGVGDEHGVGTTVEPAGDALCVQSAREPPGDGARDRPMRPSERAPSEPQHLVRVAVLEDVEASHPETRVPIPEREHHVIFLRRMVGVGGYRHKDLNAGEY